LKKVYFEAKLEHEFIKNYKVLQSVFDKKQITKHIEVNKLIKAKPLDNLEFLQWIKRYFDMHYGGHEYNALERRGGGGVTKENSGVVATARPATSSSAVSATAAALTKTASRSTPVRVAARDVSNVASLRPASAAGKRPAGDEHIQQMMEELTSLKLTVAEVKPTRT